MALKYQGNDVLDVRFNGQTVNKVNFNGVTVWERTTPPVPMRDVWEIRWYDTMETYEQTEDEEIIWDVREQELICNFISNEGSFSKISVDFEEAVIYNNTYVYESTGYQRGWNYESINYKTIKMYVDPETVFLDEWSHFLNKNGLVSHYQEPVED